MKDVEEGTIGGRVSTPKTGVDRLLVTGQSVVC